MEQRGANVLLVALLPLVLLAFAACGDDDGGATPTPVAQATATPKAKASKSPVTEEPRTADGLKAAVVSFAEAVYSGNADKAYKSLEKTCKDKVNRKQYAGQLANAAALFKHDEGIELSSLNVKTVETQNVTEDQGEARVTAEANGQEFPPKDWRAWKYEDGAWRTSECAS